MTETTARQSSLVNLGRRWLKTQLRFHGNPQRAYGNRQEADALETEMKDRAQEDLGRAVVGAHLPTSWKRTIDEIELQSAQGRAAHEARPRTAVRLMFSGDIRAELATDLPITVRRPVELNDPLLIEIEPLDPIQMADHTFGGLQVAAPAYTGPGSYDLGDHQARFGLDGWDPYWRQLWLDGSDDASFWTPGYGPVALTVSSDEEIAWVHLPMLNAAGLSLTLDATIALQ